MWKNKAIGGALLLSGAKFFFNTPPSAGVFALIGPVSILFGSFVLLQAWLTQPGGK